MKLLKEFARRSRERRSPSTPLQRSPSSEKYLGLPKKLVPFLDLEPMRRKEFDEAMKLLQFTRIGKQSADVRIRDLLSDEKYSVLVGTPQPGSPRAYVNRADKKICLRKNEAPGERAKSLCHEYLHHAAASGAEFVPVELRGEFPRGSEKYFRQHAWIWGESAKIHRQLERTGGATAMGFGQSDFFEKMAKHYETHSFEEFVKYVKDQGLDLY